jgi:hypothetical protein
VLVVAVKRLILLFWATWLSIVFLTNLFDALKALGIVGEGWAFASGNWALVLATTRIYRVPTPVVAVLFAGVMAWESLSATLMWKALGALGAVPYARGVPAVNRAFAVALGLFAAFMVADEIFIAYPVENTHMRIFVTLLVSLLALRLLPDEATARSRTSS